MSDSQEAPIYSLALGKAPGDKDEESSGSGKPVTKWTWEEVCEKTFGIAHDAAIVAAEWSPTRQVLSVWLEGPQAVAAGGTVEVQWIRTEGDTCTEIAQADENGIAELFAPRSPASGDRLVICASLSEGRTSSWEVAFPP